MSFDRSLPLVGNYVLSDRANNVIQTTENVRDNLARFKELLSVDDVIPASIHLLLTRGSDIDELDNGTLLEYLSFLKVGLKWSPRLLESLLHEVAESLLEKISSLTFLKISWLW